jgi:hypothetical protein
VPAERHRSTASFSEAAVDVARHRHWLKAEAKTLRLVGPILIRVRVLLWINTPPELPPILPTG